MRILHFSDLHLDSPFAGMQKNYPLLQEALIKAPYQAFHQGVSLAINEAVDAVVIVGDIYDTQKQTIYAQHYFLKELERLNQHDIPVILCHGNHDFLNNQRRLIQYPDNVYVFSQETVDFVDVVLADQITTCRFYGFSYLNRWIDQRKAEEFPTNPKETNFTIGLYHGEVLSQSLSGHYAPFTVEELLAKKYDYWALGHIHQNLLLNEAPPIQYAGTVQGRNRLEIGDKGAYLVTLEVGEPCQTRFVSLAQVEWRDEKIDCQEGWQVNELLTAINDMVANFKSEVENGLSSKVISLRLTNAQRLPIDLQEQIESGELDPVLPEPQSCDQFVVIVRIEMERKMVLEAFEYDQSLKQSFQEACLAMSQGDAYQETMKDLLDHATIRKWLPDLSSDETCKEETIQAAKELMIQAIGFEFKEASQSEN